MTRQDAEPAKINLAPLRKALNDAWWKTISAENGEPLDLRDDYQHEYYQITLTRDARTGMYTLELGHDELSEVREAQAMLAGTVDWEATDINKDKKLYYDEVRLIANSYEMCPQLTKAEQRKFRVTHVPAEVKLLEDHTEDAKYCQTYYAPTLKHLLTFLNERVLAREAQIDTAAYVERSAA